MKIFLFVLAYIILGFAEIVLTAFVYFLRYYVTFKEALSDVLRNDADGEPCPTIIVVIWPVAFVRSMCLLIAIGCESLFDKLADLLEGHK
ncbi:MAG: hypothetical protein MJZ11_08575 [Lachnospiraceae bacterium]|nr:hypothetical protein [Lachnospiraceae bacterium]